MSLYGDKKGKLVRRFGVNLFANPKYDRLLQRKPNAPGKERGKRYRERISEYRKQLGEKQKLMFSYGLTARQLQRLYEEAHRQKGITGNNLLRMLEMRLDSVVFKAGFAATRAQARQLVSHRHIIVNGRTTNIPSFQVKPGDRIALRPKKGVQAIGRAALEASTAPSAGWIETDPDQLQALVKDVPPRAELPELSDVQLVVEFYSR